MRRVACFAAAMLGALAARPALAQNPACSSLPNPVYGMGGSAQDPLVRAVAAALAGSSSPTTIIYDSSKGACSGINALYGASPLKVSVGRYWLPNGTEARCDLAVTGQAASFGALQTEAQRCPDIPATLPADIGRFDGPVGSVNVFVHPQSSQTSISSEALYNIYGFGADSGVAPWTDPSVIIRRNASSAVQIILGLATGIPPSRFHPTTIDAVTNPESVRLVAEAANPQAAIGFASSQVVDSGTNRSRVRSLAYQDKGQTCGYWPDSTVDAFDKANVRSGQYALWSTLKFYAKVDGAGKITDPNTEKVVRYFTERVDLPDNLDYTKFVIDAGSVPSCAMNAKREGDLGAISSYAPPNPCHCYYDFVATGATSCKSCTTSADCSGTQRCSRHKYCEAY